MPGGMSLALVEVVSMNQYTNSMKSIVSEKGQVTIPKNIRTKLGITGGVVLDFEEDHGRLVASKVNIQDSVRDVFGIVTMKKSTDEYIAEIRGLEK